MRRTVVALTLALAVASWPQANATETPLNPELEYFWISPTQFDASQGPVMVQACVTALAGEEAAVSALISVESHKGHVSASGGHFHGSRVLCRDLTIPQSAPTGELRVTLRLRGPDGTRERLDPCSLGFECKLVNTSEAPLEVGGRASPRTSAPWPTLPGCEGQLVADDRARRVERVIDGDTLVLDGGERVRLIGVDTPETVHPSRPVEVGGPEASKFTSQTALGRDVRLAYDPRTGNRDHYGRTLAYVTLDDGTVLNEELVNRGFGRADPRFPFCTRDEYRGLEIQARRKRLGLWDTSEVGFATRAAVSDTVPVGPVHGTAGGVSAGTSSATGSGPVQVRGYQRSDGTYVRPHTRSRPRQ